MIVSGKFLKVKNGKTFYCEVTLKITSDEVFSVSIDTPNANYADGEIDLEEPAILSAVLEGINLTLSTLKEDHKSSRINVSIQKIRGTVADTTLGSIFCATVQAMARALMIPLNCVEYYYEDEDFRARVGFQNSSEPNSGSKPEQD